MSLPTRKFNTLPVVTTVLDTDYLFVVGSTDELISVGNLKTIFSGNGSGGGGIMSGSGLSIASSYAELLTLPAGSEYYVEPYLYKRVSGTGVIRINPDTDFTPPA